MALLDLINSIWGHQTEQEKKDMYKSQVETGKQADLEYDPQIEAAKIKARNQLIGQLGQANADQFGNGTTGFDASTMISPDGSYRSPAELQQMYQNVANRGAGLYGVQANADVNTALAHQQEQANRLRQASTAGLLGTPATAALVDNQGLNYQSGEYAGNSALQPVKFYNQGLNMGNDTTKLIGEGQRLPYDNANALQISSQLTPAQNRLGLTTIGNEQNLANVSARNSDLIGNTVANNMLKANYESAHMAPSTLPYSSVVDSSNGTIGMPITDLMYKSPMAMTMMGMQGANTPANSSTLSSGRTITYPTATPSGWKPNLTVDENISHQEEKADALHKHNQSQVDVKMAELKADQAKLKAQKDRLKAEHLVGSSMEEYNGYTTPAPVRSDAQQWWDANSPQPVVVQSSLIGRPQKVSKANSLFGF